MKPRHVLAALALIAASTYAADSAAPAEKTFAAPHGMKVSVKMVGPYAEPADLQIVCAFKHKASGDTYLGAMKDLDARLGGLISSLRNRGEFVGELGETILFTPPKGSIPAKRMLVIGLGAEADLSLDTLRLVGRVALRSAIMLRAKVVAFAPVIRDQGNNTIDVGDGDQALIENIISAYDTEKRLQDEQLAPPFDIASWTLEAGPSYFAGATEKVQAGIANAAAQIAKRSGTPFTTLK
jgi:hypothetical protein